MKSTKILFLFLFSLIISELNSQNIITDSLTHYKYLITNPKHNDGLLASYKFFQNRKQNATDKSIASESLYYIAEAQRKMGDIYGSEESAIESLEILDDLTVSSWTENIKLSLYNHLGITSRSLFRYDKALDYYDKVLKTAKKPSDIAGAYCNIGYVYEQTGKPKLAIEKYKKAIKIASTLEDEKLLARLFDNLGVVKSELKLSEAIEDLEKALLIRKKIKFNQGLISSYMSLSEHYYRTNDFKLASYNLKEALKIADKSNNANYKKSVMSIMIDQGDYSRVVDYKRITDSISISDKIENNKYSTAKYNYNKKEKELQKSEFDKKRQKNIYIFSGFLALLGSVFIYFIIKSKHKKDKLQQVFNTESRISKKVHDEVANDVFQVMTKLQSEKPNDELLDDIEQIYNKTRDISKEQSVIDLDVNFEDILNDLILSYNDTDTNVIAKGISKVDWDAVSELKRVTIYKVMQELLINMKKHSQASVVVLTFDANRKTTLINYSDNGIGCDLKKGTGLQNVENRIISISGTITFDSEFNKGFKVKLTV